MYLLLRSRGSSHAIRLTDTGRRGRVEHDLCGYATRAAANDRLTHQQMSDPAGIPISKSADAVLDEGQYLARSSAARRPFRRRRHRQNPATRESRRICSNNILVYFLAFFSMRRAMINTMTIEITDIVQPGASITVLLVSAIMGRRPIRQIRPRTFRSSTVSPNGRDLLLELRPTQLLRTSGFRRSRAADDPSPRMSTAPTSRCRPTNAMVAAVVEAPKWTC